MKGFNALLSIVVIRIQSLVIIRETGIYYLFYRMKQMDRRLSTYNSATTLTTEQSSLPIEALSLLSMGSKLSYLLVWKHVPRVQSWLT